LMDYVEALECGFGHQRFLSVSQQDRFEQVVRSKAVGL